MLAKTSIINLLAMEKSPATELESLTLAIPQGNTTEDSPFDCKYN